jgi:hypothetical protein
MITLDAPLGAGREPSLSRGPLSIGSSEDVRLAEEF